MPITLSVHNTAGKISTGDRLMKLGLLGFQFVLSSSQPASMPDGTTLIFEPTQHIQAANDPWSDSDATLRVWRGLLHGLDSTNRSVVAKFPTTADDFDVVENEARIYDGPLREANLQGKYVPTFNGLYTPPTVVSIKDRDNALFGVSLFDDCGDPPVSLESIARDKHFAFVDIHIIPV